MESRIGPLYLVASAAGLHGVHWRKQDVPLVTSLDDEGERDRDPREDRASARGYLAGRRRVFDLPLDAAGTRFQRQVWQALRQIPYGETRSYRDIARAVKNAKAVRAVGAANGRNPIAIVVPCHRVIGADGSLTGFGGVWTPRASCSSSSARARRRRPLGGA